MRFLVALDCMGTPDTLRAMSPFRKYHLIVRTGLLILAIRVASRTTSLPRLLDLLHAGEGARIHDRPAPLRTSPTMWIAGWLCFLTTERQLFSTRLESLSVCTSVWSTGGLPLRCKEIGNKLGRPCVADAVGRALHGTHATMENIRHHVFLSALGFSVHPPRVCRHKFRHGPVSVRFTRLNLH